MLRCRPETYKILKSQGIITEEEQPPKKHEKLTEKEVQKVLDCHDMCIGFLDNLKIWTDPYEKLTWRNILKYTLLKGKVSIEEKILELLGDKLDPIFEYTYKNNLKPDNFDWYFFGQYLHSLLMNKTDNQSELPQKLTDFILKQFEDIPELTIIELNNVKTIVPKDNAEKLIQYEIMRKSFMKNLWLNTRIHYEQNFQALKDNFFKYPQVISDEVFDFYKEKVMEAFNYIYDNNLKPVNLSWKEIGKDLWLLLYHPYQTDMIKLPEEIMSYIRDNIFSWKRITLQKIEGKYTVVFADTSC